MRETVVFSVAFAAEDTKAAEEFRYALANIFDYSVGLMVEMFQGRVTVIPEREHLDI